MFKLIALLGLVTLGTAAPSFTGRVVNGTDANITDFPFMVSIRSGVPHNCGGSILNEYFVLSAAHCSGDSVEYGTDKLEEGSTVKIAYWLRHEKFNRGTLENDVAVVRVSNPMVFGENVKPVSLPEPFYEVPGSWSTIAWLIGFGYEKWAGGDVQTRLQKAELGVVSNAECDSYHYNTVYDGMICAGIPEGGKGQCSADSGGPLTINGVQVGIVSWSVKPCAVAPYPGVYTKVSHYVDWIRTKVDLQ